MDIVQYIKRIQLETKDQNYDDYVHIFEEYQNYLEGRIKENPKEVQAICQLAAVHFELRHDIKASIDIMEEIIRSTDNEMSSKDKVRVYTNLAFFYEESGEEERCLHHLKEAVALNTDYPNAYDALGRFYIENESTDDALELFEKARTLSDDIKYKYNYGIALFCNGNIAEAKTVFEELLTDGSVERRILYAYGVCCFYVDDKIKAAQIADTLHSAGNDDYITESEIADLYFLCDKYAEHNNMYDNERYAMEVNWLAPYFYALKALEDFEKLEKMFADVVAEKDREIAEAQSEELDETYTEADRAEYIQSRQKEKDDIVQAYYKIKDDEYKPLLKVKLWCMYGCYLIDCPRHQNIG